MPRASRWSRPVRLGIGALAAAWAAVSWWALPWTWRPADLASFATGWRIAASGERARLYDFGHQTLVQTELLGEPVGVGVLPYLHPPPAALFGLLLSAWSLESLSAALLCAHVAAGAALAPQLADLAGVGRGPKTAAFVGLALLASTATQLTVARGQLSLLLALALATFCHSLLDLRRRRGSGTGAVLAVLTLSVKPQLALLPAALLVATAWRARRPVVLLVSGWSVGAVLATAWFGAGVWSGWSSALAQLGDGWGQHGVRPELMFVAKGWLVGAFGYGSRPWVEPASWALFGVVGVAGTLLWIRSERPEAALAVVLGAAILCAPHGYAYDAVLLAVPLALTLSTAREHRRGAIAWGGLALLLAVGVVSTVLGGAAGLRFPGVLGLLSLLALRRA